MKRMMIAVCITGLVCAVAACGKRGTLERPPPLWGDPAPQSQPAQGG